MTTQLQSEIHISVQLWTHVAVLAPTDPRAPPPALAADVQGHGRQRGGRRVCSCGTEGTLNVRLEALGQSKPKYIDG